MSEHKILFQNTAILLDEMQNTKVSFIHHQQVTLVVDLVTHSYFRLEYAQLPWDLPS